MRPAEPTPLTLLRPPTLNGRYLVARLIGKGAQARVYLAHDTKLKQWRAVKVLAPTFEDDEHVQARFSQEARAMARLTHPNLLRVVDIDDDRDHPFMVMELARGGAITEWMKRNGPIPPVLACRIAQQCCYALGHAHSFGVVHRDVKPHNMLIRDDGTIAMTDFGIAQVAEAMSLTATGTIMGTFAFMSPEQRTDAKGVDLRADVYSLGASLYTMLTGKTSAELFFAESRDKILQGVPEILRPVILTACKYEREHRYPSMHALCDALDRRLNHLPPDGTTVPMNDHLLEVPNSPPEWIDSEAGVEELFKALTTEEGATNLSNLTGESPAGSLVPFAQAEPRDAPNPMPYRMPSGRSSAPRVDYLDGSLTFAEAPKKHKPIQIDDNGAKSIHDRPKRRHDLRNTVLLAGATGAVLAILAVLTVLLGLGAKVYSSSQLASVSEELVGLAHEESKVIPQLVELGADNTLLETAFYAYQDSTGSDRAVAASTFAATIEAEATRVGAPSLVLSHVNKLVRANRAYGDARKRRDSAAASLIGQMTGSLGVY